MYTGNTININTVIEAHLQRHYDGYTHPTDEQILEEESAKVERWENERRKAQANRIRRYDTAIRNGAPNLELSYDEWQVRGFQVKRGEKAHRYEYGVAIFGHCQTYQR